MEDNAMRAIMIGVSVFIVVITLSAVIMYVNVAKDMATAADKGLNEWDDMDVYNVMDYNGDVTIDVSGMDLINFIRKYVGNNNIRLKLGQFTDSGDPSSYQDISFWKNEIGNASEEKLMNINPNAKLKMIKKLLSDGSVNIEVVGDIWVIKQAEAGIIYGDLNSNGMLDISDYNLLNEYLTNVLTEEQKFQADVNGDDIVNYLDYTILKNYLESNYEVQISNGTGDINGDGLVDFLDRDELKKYVLTDIQRESSDINLDRVVDRNDLDKLGEILIKNGVEIPIEE